MCTHERDNVEINHRSSSSSSNRQERREQRKANSNRVAASRYRSYRPWQPVSITSTPAGANALNVSRVPRDPACSAHGYAWRGGQRVHISCFQIMQPMYTLAYNWQTTKEIYRWTASSGWQRPFVPRPHHNKPCLPRSPDLQGFAYCNHDGRHYLFHRLPESPRIHKAFSADSVAFSCEHPECWPSARHRVSSLPI